MRKKRQTKAMQIDAGVSLIAGPRIVAPTHHVIWRGNKNEPGLLLVEFASRVCYRSDGKMGANPNFVYARAREGHFSVFEHARYIFEVSASAARLVMDDLEELKGVAGVTVEKLHGRWIVSMNGSHLMQMRKNRLVSAMKRRTCFDH